ncbi:MAG: hypothetical protein QOH06_1538 [Acidobacteriota bacterium]|jgi:hypothetical protein|nr:hypothetical protein [Acidobacteriota bacterium]
MKPSRFQLFICSLLLAFALAGFTWLQGAEAQTAELTPPRPIFHHPGPPPPPGMIGVWLHYRDFQKKQHGFPCWIEESYVEDERRFFGIPLEESEIRKDLHKRLESEIKKQIGNLSRYIDITITPLPEKPLWKYASEWQWKDGIDRRNVISGKIAAQARDFMSRVDNIIMPDVYRSYYRDHGFIISPMGDGNWISAIDYKALADRARPNLQDCFDKFERNAAPADEDALTGLLVAAFQEMEFILPPAQDSNVYLSDFLIPTLVLLNRQGDCDSRATALCALRQRKSPQIALLAQRIPEKDQQSLPPELRSMDHVFLAIEAYSGNRQATVKLGGPRRFILCEAVRWLNSSPEKRVPLGSRLFSGPYATKVCMTDDCFGDPSLSIPIFATFGFGEE